MQKSPILWHRAFLLLGIPVTFAAVGTLTDILPVKMMVPLTCALIITAGGGIGGVSWKWRRWVVIALSLSAIGDIFLSNLKSGGMRFFLIGTTVYMGAHLGYIISAMVRGRFRWGVAGITTPVVGGIALFELIPRIDLTVIIALVTVYTLISTVSLGAAAGISDHAGSRFRVVLAVTAIIISDVAIGYKLFLRDFTWDPIILPAYFLAHIIFAWDALAVRYATTPPSDPV